MSIRICCLMQTICRQDYPFRLLSNRGRDRAAYPVVVVYLDSHNSTEQRGIRRIAIVGGLLLLSTLGNTLGKANLPMTITAPDTTETTTITNSLSLPVTSTEPSERLLETASLYLHIPFCHTRCFYC